MFPDFTKLGLDFVNYPIEKDNAEQAKTTLEVMQVIEPSKALALLVIWSFLAGFSERLVPTILSNAETSLANSANGTAGRSNKS